MRRGALIAALGLISLGLYGMVGLGGGLSNLASVLGVASPFTAFVLLASVLFLLYGAALALLWRMEVSLGLIALMFGLAALFRLVLVASPPELSNDIYRYVWDGRVQASGVAPWAHPPGDPALAGLRDEAVYPHINRKEARTIYPPGAQAFFRLIYLVVPDSVTGTKAVMVLADLATIGLLAWLLIEMKLPLQRVVLYAWNPLVTFEVAQSGHLEPLYLPAVVGAFLAYRRGRRVLLGALLGLATLVKLYPALLVAVFHARGERRMPLAWALVVALGYLPYLGLGKKVLGFLPTYLFNQYEEFNQGVRFLARTLFGASDAFSLLYLAASLLALAALAFVVARRAEGSASQAARGGLLLGGAYLFVITPALHPWYIIWLLALGVVWPSVTLFAASWALTLSYLKYAQLPEVLPLRVRVAEFLPLLLLFAWEGLLRHRWAGGPADRLAVTLPAVTSLHSAEYGESST
jgi:alpha-1,6-mannosyltransferase